MASRYSYLRSLKHPISLYKKEINFKMKKALFFDFNSSINLDIPFKFSLAITSISTYKSNIRRRCIRTGRSRAIDNECSFSRFVIKSRTVTGSLTGYKKSSW